MEADNSRCAGGATKRSNLNRRVATLGAGLLTSLLTCRCPCAFAAGDKLIPNSDFDTDLSGWTFPNGSFGIVWTSEDSSGHPDSGSIEIPNKWVFDMASAQSTCVSVTGSAVYQFSASARDTSDVGAGGILAASLDWYGDPNCESGLAYEEIRFLRQTWTKITRTVTAPANATSARARVWVMKMPSSTDLFARAKFDAVRLVELATSTTTTTASTCTGVCGDPVASAPATSSGFAQRMTVTATDARYILESAVGAEACDACICDVDGNGSISAADALLELMAAVDSSVSLLCPP
jgi:hypothetical protein